MNGLSTAGMTHPRQTPNPHPISASVENSARTPARATTFATRSATFP